MTLIPYVGKDESYELPFSTDFRMGPPKAGVSRPSRALSMFRNGKDTMFIAAHFKITEPTALRWISMARSNALNLADPYKAGKA